MEERTARRSARGPQGRRTAGLRGARAGQSWRSIPPPPTAWSFHGSRVDRGGRGIRRQKGDRLPGVIDRLYFLADIGRGADVHAEPVVGTNKVCYRLAVVVRAFGHDDLRRLIRMRRGPLAGFLVGRVEFWDHRLVLL